MSARGNNPEAPLPVLMPLLLLLPPGVSPQDRETFTRAAGWVAEALALLPCVPSPARSGDPDGSPYPPVTDANH